MNEEEMDGLFSVIAERLGQDQREIDRYYDQVYSIQGLPRTNDYHSQVYARPGQTTPQAEQK